ncbi:MAG: hypothetical protein ACR2JF_14655 [Iamia sp.]
MNSFSRRPVRAAAIALALAAPLGLSACGGSDISQEKLTSELQEQAGLTEEQATCVSDDLFANLDQGDINDIYSADSEDEISPEANEALNSAVTMCATAAAEGEAETDGAGG